jgi:uncharacterized membrane protein YgcG
MRSLRYAFALVLTIFLSISLASALTDVAYIYKSGANIQQPILDIFEEHGLSYELVSSRDLPLPQGQYRSVFIGDERFTAEDLPQNLPTIITTRYHGLHFRIADADGISQLTSSQPLKVLYEGQNKKVFTQSRDSSGSPISYYFIDKTNIAPTMITIAKPYETGSGSDFGSVVAYASAGDELLLGRVLQNDLCYFGIPESDYWTPFTSGLFSNCVSHVIQPLSSENNSGEETISCSSNSECDYSNPNTEDICISPGSTESSCSNPPIQEQSPFSSLTSSSTQTSITIFFELSDPSSASAIQITLDSNTQVFLSPNTTNHTFNNLSSGTQYNVNLLILPSNESETLQVSTQSDSSNNNDNSNTNTGGGSGSGSGSGGGSSSGSGGRGSSFCITEWECTSWSACSGGTQTRTCSYQEGYCEPEKDKPVESQTCFEELSLENPNEEITQTNQQEITEPQTQESTSSITGSVIGAFQQRSTFWIIAFLLIIIALYVYVNSRNAAVAKSKK